VGTPPPITRNPTAFETIAKNGGSLLLLIIVLILAFLVYRFYFAGKNRGRDEKEEKLEKAAKRK
jgi:hypothetical protein